jgi:hypothetical protein
LLSEVKDEVWVWGLFVCVFFFGGDQLGRAKTEKHLFAPPGDITLHYTSSTSVSTLQHEQLAVSGPSLLMPMIYASVRCRDGV